jgi:signal transduction histidine kinase
VAEPNDDDSPASGSMRAAWTPPLSSLLLALIALLILGMAASLVVVANEAGKRAAETEAREIVRIFARETYRESHALLQRARDAVELATTLSAAAILDPDDATTLEQFLIPQVITHEGLSAIYWGSSSGDFNFVMREEIDGTIHYRSKIIRRAGAERDVVIARRNAELRLEEISMDPDDPFDPLWRPWFRKALGARETVWTTPYRFHTSGELGISAARRVSCLGRAEACAFGADVALSAISKLMEELAQRHGVRAFVQTLDARLVASSGRWGGQDGQGPGSGTELPRIADVADRVPAAAVAALQGNYPGGPDKVAIVTFEQDGQRFLGAFTPLAVQTQGWIVGVVTEAFSLQRWLATYKSFLIPWAVALVGGIGLLGLAVWLPVRRDFKRMEARIATGTTAAAPGIAMAPRFPEFVRLADRLDSMVEQLGMQRAQLGRALADATRADEAKARFLMQMSHELRTPLNAIIGFAELAKMRVSRAAPDDDRLPGYHDDILLAARHLLAMIERVLEFSRGRTIEPALQEEHFALHEAMRTAATLNRAAADARGIRIVLSGGENVALIADRTRLSEALVNLLANAIAYGAPDGDVALEASFTAEDDLILSVRDRGVGMTKEEIALALTPFSRVERSAYVAAGTGLGLGLTIAAETARLHGGRLTIKSTPNVGTVASITLPAARLRGDGDAA